MDQITFDLGSFILGAAAGWFAGFLMAVGAIIGMAARLDEEDRER